MLENILYYSTISVIYEKWKIGFVNVYKALLSISKFLPLMKYLSPCSKWYYCKISIKRTTRSVNRIVTALVFILQFRNNPLLYSTRSSLKFCIWTLPINIYFSLGNMCRKPWMITNHLFYKLLKTFRNSACLTRPSHMVNFLDLQPSNFTDTIL